MSSRFPPSENRYTPRDRSPPRYPDRRSSTHSSSALSRLGDSYRTDQDANRGPAAAASNREVPRGPKAQFDAPSSVPSGPRRRGIPGRSEYPSLRDAPPLSDGRGRGAPRERDRDFDRRERRSPPPRIRSPPRFRDASPPRGADTFRGRRDSRDGPLSAGSNFSDPSANAFHARGGFGRDRGRGESSYRGRGRGGRFVEDRERDLFRPRSRSREPRREHEPSRDGRDIDRRDDRRTDHWDDERRLYSGNREVDSYRAPPPPSTRPSDSSVRQTAGTTDARPGGGTSTGHSTPQTSTHQNHNERPSVTDHLRSYPPSRRASIIPDAPTIGKEPRREPEKPDYFAARAEASKEKYGPRTSTPPPSAPSVPSFGFGGPTSNVWRAPQAETKPSQISVPAQPTQPVQPAKTPAAPPIAPKAQLSALPPTGPKAARMPDKPAVESKEVSTAAQPEPSKQTTIPAAPLPQEPSTASVTPAKESTVTAPPTRAFQSTPPPAPDAPGFLRAPPTGPQASIRSPTQTHGRIPPLGPRRDVSPANANANAIPLGPRASLSIDTSPRGASIPTGPKAERPPLTAPAAPRVQLFGPPIDRPPPPPPPPLPRAPMLPTGPSAGPSVRVVLGKSRQWIRPGAPTYPGAPSYASRPQIIPAKRDVAGEEKDKQVLHVPGAAKHEAERTSQAERVPALPHSELKADSISDGATAAEIVDASMVDAPTPQMRTPEPASSSREEDMDDTSEEEDGMAFDEAEFPDLAETFEKEKARLESSKIDLSSKYLRPDTPLRQLTRLAGITVHDLKVDNEFAEPETLPPAAVPTTETSAVDQGQEFSRQLTAVRRQSPESVLTPKTEEPEDITMSDGPTTPKEITDDREDSLDMSSLPFLAKGPPTPLSDKDQDHFTRNQDHVEMVREELDRRFLSAKADEEQLEKDFIAMYRPWKREFLRMYRAEEAEELERQKSAEPLPPVATTEPIATPLPTPSIEGGRRAHKFSSEYDIQLAMQESMREAEELRQRQEREAAEAKSGMEKEAELPDLLTAEEASKRRFIDTNQLRQPGQGTTAFDLEPPEDTFTPEEHKLLVQAYQGNPKKWGKLAESLPNRTYKECITHYYATKWAREYKAKDGRKKATKSRIGVRKGPARLKSSNFLADLGRRPDTEEEDAMLATPSAVSTDRSRPRRAAAPIFGDNNSELEATPVPTPGRLRGLTARENNGEGTAEKPRRTRAAKEKVPRGRGKNQPLAAAPFPSGVSPQKVDKERKEKLPTLKTEESLLTARQLAEEQAFATMQQPSRPTEQQTGYFDAISTVAAPAAVSERPRAYSNQSRAGPSSYWSVTETTDFRRYLAHFGTDFNAIASAMGGSKTVQMIKNNYTRIVKDNTYPDTVVAAEDANARRARGEDLGPPPTPTNAPRRRYENISALPRALAPNREVVDLDNSPPSQPSMPTHASPPQLQPPTRFPTLAQASSVPQQPLNPTQGVANVPVPVSQPQPHTQQQQQQRDYQRLHGPQMGYFSDVRNEPRQSIQSLYSARHHQPAAQQDIPPQQQQSQLQSQQQGLHQSQLQLQVQALTEAQRTRELALQQQQRDAQMREEQLRQQQLREQGGPQHVPRPHSFAGSPPQPHIDGPAQSTPPSGGLPLFRPLPHEATARQPQPPSHLRSLMDCQNAALQPLLDRQQPSPALLRSEIRQPPMPTQAPAQTQAAPRAAPEPRKTSNLFSILNPTSAESEEPRPKKRYSDHAVPQAGPSMSLPPTSQQQPALLPQANHRDVYNDKQPPQPQFVRPGFSQPVQMRSPLTAPQGYDGARDGNPAPPHRDSWSSRSAFGQAASQLAQPPQTHSPHPQLQQQPHQQQQPQQQQQPLAEPRRNAIGDHRAMAFGALNDPRQHAPSPPPHPQHPGFAHSRTPSYTQQQLQQQGREQPQPPASQLPGRTPEAGSARVLQANPYAQVEPPRPPPHQQPQPGVSPHLQSPMLRNEQAYTQNRDQHYPATEAALPRGVGGVVNSLLNRGRDPTEQERQLQYTEALRKQEIEQQRAREQSAREQQIQREREIRLFQEQQQQQQQQQQQRYASIPQQHRDQPQHPPFAPPANRHTPTQFGETPRPPPQPRQSQAAWEEQRAASARPEFDHQHSVLRQQREQEAVRRDHEARIRREEAERSRQQRLREHEARQRDEEGWVQQSPAQAAAGVPQRHREDEPRFGGADVRMQQEAWRMGQPEARGSNEGRWREEEARRREREEEQLRRREREQAANLFGAGNRGGLFGPR